MKAKLISVALLAAMLSPVAASAQTHELRRDRQDIRQEQRELERARRHGTPGQVHEQRRDVRDARREYREDWRDYRSRNRAAFRAPAFRAPFRYHRFSSGSSIDRRYWAPGYRVNNYARYRLPEPGRNQRYVRHYNDVLLVNVRTGRVVRAFNSFYW